MNKKFHKTYTNYCWKVPFFLRERKRNEIENAANDLDCANLREFPGNSPAVYTIFVRTKFRQP